MLPIDVAGIGRVRGIPLAWRDLGASGEGQNREDHGEPSAKVHRTEIGSIRLGRLFLTFSTHVSRKTRRLGKIPYYQLHRG